MPSKVTQNSSLDVVRIAEYFSGRYLLYFMVLQKVNVV